MQPPGVRRVSRLLLALPLLVAGCSVATGSALELPGGLAARSWGDGPYGLVLVHDAGRDAASWDSQADTFAGRGMTVLAIADVHEDAVVSAITWLRGTGIERVALLGAGQGSIPAMAVGAEHPELVDQLVVVSATGDVTSLGDFPKLFVASEQEDAAGDAERMAAEAKGEWNALFLAPGSDSGQDIFVGEAADATMAAVMRRLEERR